MPIHLLKKVKSTLYTQKTRCNESKCGSRLLIVTFPDKKYSVAVNDGFGTRCWRNNDIYDDDDIGGDDDNLDGDD